MLSDQRVQSPIGYNNSVQSLYMSYMKYEAVDLCNEAAFSTDIYNYPAIAA